MYSLPSEEPPGRVNCEAPTAKSKKPSSFTSPSPTIPTPKELPGWLSGSEIV